MKYRTWTDEDIKLLAKMYETHNVKDIAIHFNTTESNIRSTASINKISKASSRKKRKKIDLCNATGFNEYTYG